jgi:hypothetical protein
VISALRGFFRDFNLFHFGLLLFKFSFFDYVAFDWHLNVGKYFG